MTRKTSGAMLFAAAVLLLTALVVWWAFGWSTVRITEGDLTFRRSFGRVVKLSLDINGDGTAEDVTTFSWSAPFSHADREICLPGMVRLLDTNLDGRYDTEFVAEEGLGATLRIRTVVDLDFDSHPDWTLEFPCRDLDRVMEAVLIASPFPHRRCGRSAPRSTRAAEVVCGWADEPPVLTDEQAVLFWRNALTLEFVRGIPTRTAEDLAAGLLPMNTDEWPPEWRGSLPESRVPNQTMDTEDDLRERYWHATWGSSMAPPWVAR